MFQAAIRAARPAALANRSVLKTIPSRAISTTVLRRSDHGPAPPGLFGPGAKPGEIPTDELQATGLERLQLLGEMEGIEVFDTEPLDSSRIGTLIDPIRVPSLDVERVIGCTGSPADSHDLLWFTLKEEKKSRCPECGSVYALDFQGSHEAHDAHHH